MDVHIIGTGGLAKEIISYCANYPNHYTVIGAWGDEPFNNDLYASYYLGTIDEAASYLQDGENALLAVAVPKIRKILVEKLPQVNWVSYIHRSAEVSKFAKIGKGCVITPQCIVTSDAILEDFVFMNTGSVVGHDSKIGSFTTMFPNTEVCGDCDIGDSTVIGIGSFILPKVKLEPYTKVSAGSVVWKSPGVKCKLAGNPAVIMVD